MKVQMVPSEVRENGNLEMQPHHPLQFDGVRGHFHDGVLPSAIHNPPEQCLQFRSFRRCALGRKLKAGPAILDRAEHGCGKTRSLQNRFDQIGRGRLAVGSRNADGMQLLCGMPVEVRGKDGQRFALVGNLNPCRSGICLAWQRRNDCGSTTSDRIGHEPVAIHLQSTNGHKQEPGQHLSRVERDSRDPRRPYRRECARRCTRPAPRSVSWLSQRELKLDTRARAHLRTRQADSAPRRGRNRQ